MDHHALMFTHTPRVKKVLRSFSQTVDDLLYVFFKLYQQAKGMIVVRLYNNGH